ncbi:TetR/AcrR family transcriptional regulator [Streptomyces sp. SCA3-4]|uniref:ScbR family autoregulator-binding transcription factor n=1 Tax=Streptomyces sichuanensis TaxID=2871810 RepID=UPI001CE30490|nr:ScbR family autoregulator-binding transcription factor [Streptomyces sichuanensis]MCA6090666.1 TetR/AcrR family transcriptional regulator [Streptomyces sichuanensis]
MAKPKQFRSEQTRQALILAAAELFDRYGYGATSVSDILEYAASSKGAMYFHFAGKEELAHAVVEEQHRIWTAEAEVLASAQGSGLELMLQLSRTLAELLRTNVVVRAGIRLTFENATYRDPVPGVYRDWVGILTGLLERARDQRELRADVHPDFLARVFVSSYTGAQVMTQALGAELSPLLGEMWEALLPGAVHPRKLAHFRAYARALHCGDVVVTRPL